MEYDLRDKIYTACYEAVEAFLCKLCPLVPCSSRYIWLESEIDFAENSRALYEYMISHEKYKNKRIIWCVDNPDQYKPHKNVSFIKRNMESFPFLFYKNRCKYFIFTHPYWLRKWKKSQIVINAGHGNPFKQPPRPTARLADYWLASSETWETFRRKETVDGVKIPLLGAPRLDWLYQKVNYLSQMDGGRHYSKTIYCMPTFKKTETWKDSDEKNPYSINVVATRQELLYLNEEMKKRDILLVCIIHHLQTMEDVTLTQLSNILYLRDVDYGKKGLVMNQVLTSADALCTDYSGVFLDYILLDRPIGFFCNTRDQYTRGFTMENPDDYMPGPRILGMEDFLAFADSLLSGRDDYRDERKRVKNIVHKYQDDQNCRRFLEYFQI